MKNYITKIAIIGTANIARKNIRAIMLADNICCILIASRCHKRALKFSKENNVPRSVGNYGLALQDNDIDAFYLLLHVLIRSGLMKYVQLIN